jgi:nucleoside-diphosphate-sugar epimerase
MKTLVIGGSGFLSGAVVRQLQAAEHEVTVFTRGRRPPPDGVKTITGDRHDVDTFVQAFEGRPFDAVVDCIAFTPEDAHADLRAFAGRIGHLVMISTDFVYGSYRTLPMEEDTATQALNDYGRSKAATEEALLTAWRDEGFPVSILRPPHILGSGSHLGSGSLQGRDPALLARLEAGGPVMLLDGGQLLIQPVHKDDIGRACAAVLAHPDSTRGEVYNCAGPDRATTRAYYDLIAAAIGAEAVEYLSLPSKEYVRALPEKAPFSQHRLYSVEKLVRDTGYRPSTTLAHALFETIDWLQSSGAAQPYVPTGRDENLAMLDRAFREELQRLL